MTSLVLAPSLYIIAQLKANLTHSITTTAVDVKYVSFSTLRVYFIDSTSALFCTHKHTSAIATIVLVGPIDLLLLPLLLTAPARTERDEEEGEGRKGKRERNGSGNGRTGWTCWRRRAGGGAEREGCGKRMGRRKR